jgi:hypothetical protein
LVAPDAVAREALLEPFSDIQAQVRSLLQQQHGKMCARHAQ